jgi:hypothetical protein
MEHIALVQGETLVLELARSGTPPVSDQTTHLIPGLVLIFVNKAT